MDLTCITLAPRWPVVPWKLARCRCQSMSRLGVVNATGMEAAGNLEDTGLFDALGILLPIVLQLVVSHPLMLMLPCSRIWTTTRASVKLVTPPILPEQ